MTAITPVQFAEAVRSAVAERCNALQPQSISACTTRGCIAAGISPDWAVVVQGFLDSSYQVAMLWADRQLVSAMDSVQDRITVIRGIDT